ncbi:protein of unknown function [Latilactobacillus sakei]|nr:protein of unknown function [Latilactobacillus sakei]
MKVRFFIKKGWHKNKFVSASKVIIRKLQEQVSQSLRTIPEQAVIK